MAYSKIYATWHGMIYVTRDTSSEDNTDNDNVCNELKKFKVAECTSGNDNKASLEKKLMFDKCNVFEYRASKCAGGVKPYAVQLRLRIIVYLVV